MKTVLTLALFVGTFTSLRAQLYLNQRYDFDTSNDWGYSVIAEPTNTYIVFSSVSKQSQLLGSKRIDHSGLEISSKIYPAFGNYNSSYSLAGTVKPIPSGGYYMPFRLWKANVGIATLAKVDGNGDLIWTKLLSDTTNFLPNENVWDCSVMPDGGVVATMGTSVTGLLKRLDSNGNILWSVSKPLHVFYSCEYIGNGKILVGAVTSYNNSNRPNFIVFDTAGNKLYDTICQTKYRGGGFIRKDANGGFFHLGNLDSVLVPDESLYNYPPYLAHLNDNFQFTWTKSFASTPGLPRKSISTVLQLKDGNYLVVGDIDYRLGWATKVDKNGWTIWSSFYFLDSTWTSTAHFTHAAERADGSIVFTGRHGISTYGNKTLNWRKTDVWLVVVDSNGCVIPNCNPLSVSQMPEKDEMISVYPNPTKGKFFVRVAEAGVFELFDTRGKLVLRLRLEEGKSTVDLPPSLPFGFYTCRFATTNGATITSIKLFLQP